VNNKLFVVCKLIKVAVAKLMLQSYVIVWHVDVEKE